MAAPSPDQPVRMLEISNQSECFESPIDRHYRGRPYHKAEDIGSYLLDKMVAEMESKLLRSRRDYMVAPSGMSRVLAWTSLLFEWDIGTFVHVLHKGNSYGNERAMDLNYKVIVVAATVGKVTEVMEHLRQTYRGRSDEGDGPGFFILTDASGHLQWAPLESRYLLGMEDLELQYGEGFAAWSQQFLTALHDPGISILRGDPGTGKTTYLRHVMSALHATHRFYFIPVDVAGILAPNSMANFWKKENREFGSAHKVFVFEDAEAMLRSREVAGDGPVSAILNLTDGLMRELVKVHLVCTLNTRMETIDKALLRPGRLQAFRVFERLEYPRAKRLAEKNGRELPEERDYTLAEVFAAQEHGRRTDGLHPEPRKIGFA